MNYFGLRDRVGILSLTASCVLIFASMSVVGAQGEDESIQEVVVTGSRLSAPGDASASPVVVVGSEEFLHQGTARTEELLNSLPQVNSGLTLGANGPSVAPLTGTATADLRGIGAFRTLVLVNGRRTAPGDPINPSADLNTVPSALVKRVEVLTGGASAVYGSDAVAGVVNFILDTNFNGFKFDLEGGANRGTNTRSDLQGIARANGVSPATGSGFDGGSIDMTAVWGRSLLAGRAHVTGYAGYRQTQQVLASARDYSACTLIETATSFDCLLDGTTAKGQFVPNFGAATPGAALTLDAANGHTFRALNSPADLYNPVAFQDLQRPDTRYQLGAFANLELSPKLSGYAEAQYTRDTTTAHYEPAGTTATGAGLNAYGINCNNPLLSASQVNDLCGAFGLGALDTALVGIGRRNVEGGARTDNFQHQSYRLVLGIKGTLSEPWSYDANVLYGRVNARETLRNDLSNARLANALNVVSVGGVARCQSVVDGSDPACVPYDIFSTGGVTPAALAYISAGGHQVGDAERSVVSAQLVGALGKYGWKSPWADAGMDVALGAEYRRESVRNSPDAAYTSGDLLVTGAARPTAGSFQVGEVFAEFKMPLIENRPFAQRLQLKASDRYARYSPQGGVNAFGVGLEWAPVHAVRLRASLSRAVRAPNAYELFSSRVLGQINLTDPCADAAPAATLAQCARTGVTAAQYGAIAPQSTINVVTGGNPALKPETADSMTVGLELAPVNNLMFSVDYWRIKVRQYVGGLPGSFTLDTCLNTGNPYYCNLIQRDTSGSLSTGNGASAGRIVATRFNTGSYGNSGVDFEGRYSRDLQALGPRAGTLSFSFTGSLAIDNPINVTPGVAAIDCSGLFGPNCSGAGPTSPVPRWRHRLRTTWEGGHELTLSLNWRHIGRLSSEFTSANPSLGNPANVFAVDARLAAYDYFDFDAGMALADKLQLRLGVNNLGNRQPPIVGFAANPLLVNGNLVAGMYDMLGRYVFLGATLTL